jgi:hypothetical protein
MDDSVVFSPLTTKVTARQPVAKNADVLLILNKDFRESLTLRSLVLLCEACCMRPTAPMLAFALQNSIPGLVGLPMDNPDAGFYIDIAKKFFDPTDLTFERKVRIYRTVHNYDRTNDFFPDYINLDAPHGGSLSNMDFYVIMNMYGGMGCTLRTKKRRNAVKEVMLEWKAVYERTAPNDLRYPRFINHILNILEHGMILRHRYLLPGGMQEFRVDYKGDEHL